MHIFGDNGQPICSPEPARVGAGFSGRYDAPSYQAHKRSGPPAALLDRIESNGVRIRAIVKIGHQQRALGVLLVASPGALCLAARRDA
jgi:hypothetical protein